MTAAASALANANHILRQLAHRPLIQFMMGTGVRLDLGNAPYFEVTAETRIVVLVPGKPEWRGEPLHAEVAARLLQVLSDEVVHVKVTTDSTLTIDFSSGVRILVPPDDHYEAWQVRSDDGLQIVCMPGGDLAIWEF